VSVGSPTSERVSEPSRGMVEEEVKALAKRKNPRL
jgi:hypothetical protein